MTEFSACNTVIVNGAHVFAYYEVMWLLQKFFLPNMVFQPIIYLDF